MGFFSRRRAQQVDKLTAEMSKIKEQRDKIEKIKQQMSTTFEDAKNALDVDSSERE